MHCSLEVLDTLQGGRQQEAVPETLRLRVYNPILLSSKTAGPVLQSKEIYQH